MIGRTTSGSAAAATPALDEEIDEWEREQVRQQRAFEDERQREVERERERKAKEDAVLQRLFGGQSGSGGARPPTRWAKPQTRFHFFAESEFLRRTPRLSELLSVYEDVPPTSPAQPVLRQAASPSPAAPDWLQPGASSKPDTPKLRRARSSLHVIEEDAEDGRTRPWSIGTAGSGAKPPRGILSRGSSRSSARVLFSTEGGASTLRVETPQSPQTARKYGESAPVRSWSWASFSRTGSGVRTSDSDGHVDGESLDSRLFPGSVGKRERTRYDQLIVEDPPRTPGTPGTPGFKFERIKLFNEKTGVWVKSKDQLAEIAKDPAGHGDTVYPRIPQVFQDPAQTLADALLHAKTPEETKMLLDQIAMDLRPGSFQASLIDFEAGVGLVLQDEFHGVMIDFIEAGSSAAEAKGISRGDYVLEVNNTDVRNRSADQVESLLLGKEDTTVTVVVQTEHYGKPRSVTLMRRSYGAGQKQAPKDFSRKDEELIWSAGYNEFGQLNHGNNDDTAALILCQKKKLARYDLRHRIHMVACGWYHTVLVARQRWTTGKPKEFKKEELKNEEFLTTEEIATMLAHWATPHFRRTVRSDIELSDDPEDLMEDFGRKEIIGLYMSMIESGSYGSAKKNWCTFACGLNKSGQLGQDDKENVSTFQPIERLIAEKVDLVACGGHHTLLLMNNGAVMAFGANRHGQLGNGTVSDAATPQIVTALTQESTRNPSFPTPSRVLLVTNLDPYVGKSDVAENFKTCFGYQGILLRGSDRTEVPGPEPETKKLPVALIFFMDIVTAAHAMKKFQGKIVGGKFLKREMIIYYFHPHQSGRDWSVWTRTKLHRCPCVVPVGNYVKQIAAGYDHSMALLTNGQVLGWGHNNWGQVGTEPLPGIDPEILLRMKELPEDAHLIQVLPIILSFTRHAFPGEPNVGTPAKVKLMAIGGNHDLFLLDDGRVMACGRNDNKQLGLGPGSGQVYHQVVEVTGLNKYDVRTICAGASHSLAVLYDGRVFSWGRNDSFQCGHFEKGAFDVSLPTEIEYLTEMGKSVVCISANEHTILVCGDGEAFAWGLNVNGQLGLSNRDRIFRRLERPSWAVRGVCSIPLTGAFHTYVFNRMPLVSGAYQYEPCVFAWGYNKHGELGMGFATEVYRNVAVGAKTPSLITHLHMREIELFACGWYHAFCIYHDQRDLRQDFVPPSSEEQPDDGMPEDMARTKRIPKPPEKKEKKPGFMEALFVPKPPKQYLVGWGYNRRGQLGLGHSQSQCKPVTIDLVKWGVETRVTQICCGGMSSYVVTEDHNVFAFGSNTKGQLGIGNKGGREKAPVKISGLSGKHVKSLAAGYDHCFALVSLLGKIDVHSWGANSYGQLGLGHSEDVTTPTHVKALSAIRVNSVACGGQHTIVVAPDSVWAMGRNDYGQLGLSHRSSTERSPPQKIKFLSHAKPQKTTNFVSCGASHTLFVLFSGELLGCGRNDSGQLGLGLDHLDEAVVKPTWILTQQMLNGNKVTGVTAGDHTIVSLSNGEIIGCGANHNGQLGLGNVIMSADFQTLPLDSLRADVMAGAFHTFVRYHGPHPRRARNASGAAVASGVCCVS